MIRTEPGGDRVDPLETQLSLRRGHADRPWVMANFISTIDGAAVVDGGSTAINDADDKAMFAAIRAVPDFIVVGAGTVRAEDYRPVTLNETRRAARTELGLEPTPHLVVVSATLSLDPGAPVFSDPKHRVTVLTGTDAPDDKFGELSQVADVVRLRDTGARDIVHYMRMAKVVLCEGGPSLLGQFIAADLVDEMALTIAPVLVGGEASRVAVGAETGARPDMDLDRVLYGDRMLFLRYVRSFETS
ncbi:MAG: dihydrofolate reductase family protein [Acidimicrobiia bacterium]|jgi:riboflavin biosynthesis pyrimidine reductase